MKKYSLIGIIGLAVLAIGFALRYLVYQPNTTFQRGSSASQRSLFAHLPDTTDQIMRLTITPQTKTFLLQSNPDIDQTVFANTLDSLQQIIIAQASVFPDTDQLNTINPLDPNALGETYAAIILQGNESFSIDQIKALGILYFDTGYDTIDLGNNTWLYGDQASLAYFRETPTKLIDDDSFTALMRKPEINQATVFFYSRPTANNALDPLSATFAQKLSYSYMYGTPDGTNSQGTFVLQFTGTSFGGINKAFRPEFSSLISDTTLMYIEAQHLLETFGLSETQFSLGLPLLLGQLIPGVNTLLSSTEITNLYTAINNGLGILINVSPSAFGVGIHLLLNNPEAFTSLRSLSPLRRTLLAGISGMGTGGIQEEQTASSRGLSMAFPAILPEDGSTGAIIDNTLQLPLFQISQEETYTRLSLFESVLPPAVSAPKNLLPTDNVLATFRYDPAILAAFEGINPLAEGIGSQLSIFGTGALLGTIRVERDLQQLLISFQNQ